MEIELDGQPRNQKTESSNATRWRVGEAEIIADVDVATNLVRIMVGDRHVADMTGPQNSHRFTLAPRGGYRGGEQAEARIQRDPRTGALSLWVEGIEVPPTSKPVRVHSPSPGRPPQAPRIERLEPPSAMSVRWIVFGILLVAFLALFAIPKLLTDETRKRATDASELETKTAACLKRADTAAEQAKAKLGEGDPAARMQAETQIDDQRRLARIACKENERDCKRDPKSLPCLMGK